MNSHDLRFGSAPSRTPGFKTQRVVLLALFERGKPTVSLMRAFAFAGLKQAELHVLRVLPALTGLDQREHYRHDFAAGHSVDRTMRAIGSTRSWLRRVLGDHAAALTVVTAAHGDFPEQVAQQAKLSNAGLIVMPAREASIGAAATCVACKCESPVLVARAAMQAETIVAATDLEVPGYPVLRAASALGRQLDAPLVTLHNMQPLTARSGMEATGSWIGGSGLRLRRAREPELAEISAKLHAGALAVIRRESDPVAAILGEAHAHNADLVVVGARRRSWLDRIRFDSVATQVVDRAQRSVLITPVHAAAANS